MSGSSFDTTPIDRDRRMLADLEREERTLASTWAEPRGLIGWLSHVDHKSIGRRFFVTAFMFSPSAGSKRR